MSGFQALWRKQTKAELEAEPVSPVLMQINGFEIQWRKSARRKRSLALKMDRDGNIIAMTPQNTTQRALRAFITQRLAWLEKQKASFEQARSTRNAQHGLGFMYLGEWLEIQSQITQKNQTELLYGAFIIGRRQSLALEKAADIANKWLRKQAEAQLPLKLAETSARTQLYPEACEIKSYRARWGSCRQDAKIQLNWKLIQAPKAVQYYVMVHELCHLAHFNHSAAFWSLVARHCPDYKQHRKWLKSNGRALLT